MMLLCGIVLVCALQPSLTRSIAGALYGGKSAAGENGDEELPDREADGADTAGTWQEDGSPAGEKDGQPSGGNGTASGENASVPGLDGVTAGDNGYSAPDKDALRLPEKVADKTGCQPVQEQAQEVAGEEADGLLSSLSVGNTGDHLSFDTAMYPYYGMLDTQMQSLYRQIYANADSLQKSFAPVVLTNVNQLKNVFEAVCNDHPELFWLETGYSCKYRQDGGCVEIDLEFNRLANDLAAAKTAFETQAQNLLSGAQGLGTDYEKEKYIHDALLTGVEYNTAAELNQSAYSAMVNGQSVCAGYARAFQYLLQRLGIPSYYCTGYSGENHAWNIVRLQEDYYNVDSTWDDTAPPTYDYFNRTDADYASTHVRQGLSVYLPACNGTALRGLESSQPKVIAGISSAAGADAAAVQETQPSGESGETAETAPAATPLPGPMTWTSSAGREQDSALDALAAAGYGEGDVLTTMESYYADCLEQIAEAGSGQQQFTNVISASLWSSVERAYSDGGYQTGYVKEALKKLDMTDFAIQLQAQGIGGNTYYVLYHNVSTW